MNEKIYEYDAVIQVSEMGKGGDYIYSHMMSALSLAKDE